MMQHGQHGQWSSRLTFTIAAIGSAVGLGNIWKFPYVVGEHGGGAFVLLYIACVLLVGVPIMVAETLLGRRGGQNPVGTMAALASEAGADPRWRHIGGVGMAAGFLILSYYSVIAGWAGAYVVKAATGSFYHADAAAATRLFDQFIASPGQLVFWHSAFIVATMAIVRRGLHQGFEKALLWMIPGLFGLMVLLLGYAMTTPGYFQGLGFMFNFQFSQLTAGSVLVALGQAFFSLGVGMGSALIYGAYLPKTIPIARTMLVIAGADTLVAVLAGLVIFPLVFSHDGLSPGSGPGLIFQTLPIAFGNMLGGGMVGCLFFIMLVFAALSSSIALIEPAVSWLVETKNLSRGEACLWSGLAAWALGLATVFSFNHWSQLTVFGLNPFQLVDNLSSNLLLPLGGLAIAVFAGWVMKPAHSQAELAADDPRHYQLWLWLVRYAATAAVVLVFLDEIGLL